MWLQTGIAYGADMIRLYRRRVSQGAPGTAQMGRIALPNPESDRTTIDAMRTLLAMSLRGLITPCFPVGDQGTTTVGVSFPAPILQRAARMDSRFYTGLTADVRLFAPLQFRLNEITRRVELWMDGRHLQPAWFREHSFADLCDLLLQIHQRAAALEPLARDYIRFRSFLAGEGRPYGNARRRA